MDELLEMSTKELSRLEVIQKLAEKRMSQEEAASILGIGERQVKRLLRAYRASGAKGLVSKRRGRASNNRLSEETRQKVLNLLRGKHKGFGPMLAREKLVELEGLKISDERVRQLMIEENLWKAKKHDWFEGRAPPCSLLVFVDDATGQLEELCFVESESFLSYCQAAKGYLTRHGKSIALYSDKHGVFRGHQPSASASDALTQFGRANQILQDRLPQELRLRGISSWEAGNAYLPEFIQDFNRRFAVAPRRSLDVHRPLAPTDDLTPILSHNLTIQFNKIVYQTHRPSCAMRRASVTVGLDQHANLHIVYKGNPLEYAIFHRQTKQAEVVDSKLLDHTIPNKPAPDHPWHKGFATPLSRSK